MKKTDGKVYWFSIFLCALCLTVVAVVSAEFLKLGDRIQYRSYYYNLTVGDIASEDISAKSKTDIVDVEATEKAKTDAAKSVLPQFSFNGQKTLDVYIDFASIDKNAYSDRNLKIAYSIIQSILDRGFYRYSDITKNVPYDCNSIQISSTDEIIEIENLVTDLNLSDVISMEIDKYDGIIGPSDRNEIRILVSSCLQSNISYDETATLAKKQYAQENTEPIIKTVNKGQILVQKDTVITKDQVDLISLMITQNNISLFSVVSDALFSLMLFVIECLILTYFIKDDRHYRQYLVILVLGSVLTFGANYLFFTYLNDFIGSYIEAALPICFLPVLMTLVTNKKEAGFTAAFIVSTGFSILPGTSLVSFFYCSVTGCVCVLMVRFLNKRVDTIIQWILMIVSSFAITAFFMFISNAAFDDFHYSMLSCAGIISVSQLILLILIPALERVFNLPTVFRLQELAYTESSLLKKLSQSAPGTYNHSRQVADLAATAAKAVGANELLCRVGGLYHDVGKIDHPEYFVENQSGLNKHDDINPSLSASIIKNHVKSGAEKGRIAHLPIEIVDIIANHHGNDVISYFYYEAVKDNEDKEKERGEVQKSDFSYNAEIPGNRECAIVMIADSVEAAARTVTEPTTAKFSKLINQIVLTKIEHGQLKNCHLSMNDLEAVSQSFLKTLSAFYHNRIEYPDEDED